MMRLLLRIYLHCCTRCSPDWWPLDPEGGRGPPAEAGGAARRRGDHRGRARQLPALQRRHLPGLHQRGHQPLRGGGGIRHGGWGRLLAYQGGWHGIKSCIYRSHVYLELLGHVGGGWLHEDEERGGHVRHRQGPGGGHLRQGDRGHPGQLGLHHPGSCSHHHRGFLFLWMIRIN